jgi:hypothetical protein
MDNFKKLVLGNAGKKRVKSGNWSLFGLGKKKKSKPKEKLYPWSSSDKSGWGVRKEGGKYRVRSYAGDKTLWDIDVKNKREAEKFVKERRQHMEGRSGRKGRYD